MNSSEKFIKFKKVESKGTLIAKENFDSMTDLMNRVKNKDLYEEFFQYRSKSDQSSRYEGDSSWNGTDTIEEAYRYTREGWAKGIEDVPDLFVSHFEGIIIKKYGYGVTGLAIDMGKHLAGRPDSWLKQRNEREKGAEGKVKRILVGGSFLGDVSGKSIKNRGSAIMAIIDVLEHLGYSVELTFAYTSRNASTGGYTRHSPDGEYDALKPLSTVFLTVKQADAPLNRERVFWAMNPAIFRRFVFAIREQYPKWLGKAQGSGYGYGRTIDIDDFIEKYMPEAKDDYDLIIGDQTKDLSHYETIKSSVKRVKDLLAMNGIELELDE